MVTQRYIRFASSNGAYWLLLLTLGILIIGGVLASRYMANQGHWVTGMNNRIVWGLPHVVAIFLIVAASGALNVASISSVFGRAKYKAWARLSGLMAMTLLVGGLLVLVLDLGRPERLIVAMTHYNLKSIFAWNVFLYIGFLLIVAVYLWMMFEQRMNRFTRIAGTIMFAWRIILTTGTGSIFGFLVSRQAYDMAVMGPLFIAMSLSFGTAVFVLAITSIHRHSELQPDTEFLADLRNLLGIFVITVLYITCVFHLTKLYSTELHGVEHFILFDRNVYSLLFWGGQVLLGSLLPLLLLFWPTGFSIRRLVISSGLVIVGGFVQLYVIIIGGQAYPLEMFPGMAVSSRFFDGEIAQYAPSFPELALGLGGIAVALLMTVLGMRVLPFLPSQPVTIRK